MVAGWKNNRGADLTAPSISRRLRLGRARCAVVWHRGWGMANATRTYAGPAAHRYRRERHRDRAHERAHAGPVHAGRDWPAYATLQRDAGEKRNAHSPNARSVRQC